MTTKTILRLIAKAILPAALAATVAIPAMTNEAPLAGWVGTEFQRDAVEYLKPAAIPAWTKADAKNFPACEATVPGTNNGLVNFVVVKGDGSRVFMEFGEVFDRNESDNRADDVWVIGTCEGGPR